jgi:SpoVK/Ycf46/Vps4 family AAA+-type ATPase
MIKINNDLIVDSTDMVLLQNVEKDLESFIKKLLIENSPDLSVILQFELFAKTENSIVITGNDGFSIPGSLEIKNKIQKYLTSEQALTPILKKYSLEVKCTYRITEKKKDKKEDSIQFLPQHPRYNFEQVILPDETRKEIYDALKVIQYKKVVYEDWGFEECDPIPRSVINFYGDPGTGKTMCAHAIAGKLGKMLLSLNYAEIESKYVGEAPKNLQKAFDTAKQTDSVLFFDEADSFLGKRIQNVTQGSEQALNSLRSQMLILLEEHSGVVIFATNLVSNFDKAFESRILKHIKFELPNHEARIAIIKKMIPSKLPLASPLDETLLNQCSDILDGFSGREIKSAILELLLSKVDDNHNDFLFNGNDFIEAFEHKKEQKKKLKDEETRIQKEKILRKLSEIKEEKELKEAQSKEQEESNDNSSPAQQTGNLSTKEENTL